MIPEVKNFREHLPKTEKVLFIGKPIGLPAYDYEKENYVITASMDEDTRVITISDFFIDESGVAEPASEGPININLEILQLMYHIFVPGANRADARDIISWSGEGTLY